MIKNLLIEVCAGSIEDCIVANEFDIDRIELNSALELGGLTPSIATLINAKTVSKVPICCMVRPRTAGFLYTEKEFESMLEDADLLLKNDADGIVFGFLNEDNTINKERTNKMVRLIHSYDKEAIFHKAFDATPDKIVAVETLIDCKVNRILTSGGQNYPNINEGYPILNTLIKDYSDKITILVGGGVRDFNIKEIIEETNCKEIHMTASHEAYDNGKYKAVSKDNLIGILSNI